MAKKPVPEDHEAAEFLARISSLPGETWKQAYFLDGLLVVEYHDDAVLECDSPISDDGDSRYLVKRITTP